MRNVLKIFVGKNEKKRGALAEFSPS